jgi:hypothetical protein
VYSASNYAAFGGPWEAPFQEISGKFTKFPVLKKQDFFGTFGFWRLGVRSKNGQKCTFSTWKFTGNLRFLKSTLSRSPEN